MLYTVQPRWSYLTMLYNYNEAVWQCCTARMKLFNSQWSCLTCSCPCLVHNRSYWRIKTKLQGVWWRCLTYHLGSIRCLSVGLVWWRHHYSVNRPTSPMIVFATCHRQSRVAFLMPSGAWRYSGLLSLVHHSESRHNAVVAYCLLFTTLSQDTTL